RLAELHGRGPSGELVLHPPEVTRRFANPSDLTDARSAGVLRPLRADPGMPYEMGPQVGRLAPQLDADPALYRLLRSRALALLEYLTAHVRELSGAERALRVTAAVYDEEYGALLDRRGVADAHASLHETGCTFYIQRRS